MGREYYLTRSGEESGAIELNLDELKRSFLGKYMALDSGGYFSELFGKECPDGDTVGTAGIDHELFFAVRLSRRGLYPIDEHINDYTDSELFAVIEFLYDHVSKPATSRYHDWYECGNHFSNFDKLEGQIKFADGVNEVLGMYEKPHQLSSEGEIQRIVEGGLEGLFDPESYSEAPVQVRDKILVAIRKFRRHSASATEQREAVRNLADVLESERKDVKKVFTAKDEGDLFNIANKFSIRHLNRYQRSDYPDHPWLDWIFVTYLNAIHLLVELQEDKY